MARSETVHIFIFIVFFVVNAVYLVECEDKRIIIYVPRRVKTVHHHHHHVVLMDPNSKTVMHARPYADKSSEDVHQQQRDQGRDHQHQQRQQQQQHQYARHQHQHQQQQHQHHHHQVHHQQSAVGYPVSFTEQRKTVRTGIPPPPPPPPAVGDPDGNVNLLVYPAASLPLVHVPMAYTTWPARKKRSKVIARLYTY